MDEGNPDNSSSPSPDFGLWTPDFDDPLHAYCTTECGALMEHFRAKIDNQIICDTFYSIFKQAAHLSIIFCDHTNLKQNIKC